MGQASCRPVPSPRALAHHWSLTPTRGGVEFQSNDWRDDIQADICHLSNVNRSLYPNDLLAPVENAASDPDQKARKPSHDAGTPVQLPGCGCGNLSAHHDDRRDPMSSPRPSACSNWTRSNRSPSLLARPGSTGKRPSPQPPRRRIPSVSSPAGDRVHSVHAARPDERHPTGRTEASSR